MQKTEMAFEETELRLGLALALGLGTMSGEATVLRKRGFSETKARDGDDEEEDEDDEEEDESDGSSTTVDLMLNLSPKPKEGSGTDPSRDNHVLASHPSKPPAPKAQVVGWPPVRSFRKNMFAAQKSNGEMESEKNSPNASFVKVSMDGAPYLRKVDLKMYKSYPQLSDALGKMFSSFTIGNCESQGFKDFMNESKLMDLLNSSDYVPTYEDKDGDWMLVGDVPWEMFVESCKRLRIMKGKEAIGLAPRAMEKCKNRS